MRRPTRTATEPLTSLAVPHHLFQSVLDDDPASAQALLGLPRQRLREAEAG